MNMMALGDKSIITDTESTILNTVLTIQFELVLLGSQRIASSLVIRHHPVFLYMQPMQSNKRILDPIEKLIGFFWDHIQVLVPIRLRM